MVTPTIEDAILESTAVVILWSANYAKSPWCYDELDLAIQRSHSSELPVWVCNIDGSDVVPRHARRLPQILTRTPEQLVQGVLQLVKNHTALA